MSKAIYRIEWPVNRVILHGLFVAEKDHMEKMKKSIQ